MDVDMKVDMKVEEIGSRGAGYLRTSRQVFTAIFGMPEPVPAVSSSLSASPVPQAAVNALARRNAGEFCKAILPAVSRTFALGIKVLPGDLGHAVLDAYLLCRIADTVEDEPNADPAFKADLLNELIACFEEPQAIARFERAVENLMGDAAHLMLTQNAALVFEHFSQLPAGMQAVVSRWVIEMATGMRKFVLLYPNGIRIQTLDEYQEYCYYVAGTVGYMLTDLWREHSAIFDKDRYALLSSRARAFAEALQTVNILKDIAVDVEQENSIYVPQQILEQHGSSHGSILSPDFFEHNRAAVTQLIDLAWFNLAEAQQYIMDLPRRAVSIRLFCILPQLLACATLRELVQRPSMLKSGGKVKITRREVKTLLLLGTLVSASNSGVRWLAGRVRSKPFELPVF